MAIGRLEARGFVGTGESKNSGFCSTGAAEDGRAPTEEVACVDAWGFCSTGAAEDGRAPTKELSCVDGKPAIAQATAKPSTKK